MTKAIAKRGRGQPPHRANAAARQAVEQMSAVGIDQETISGALKIDPKTLRKWYAEELDHAATKANAAVGGKLYNKAMSGDTTAMIFWLKTRMGWKETNHVEHVGDFQITVKLDK
jgi:hypothetical protein